ncbi:MAG TPA: DUF4382 domain-containing protein [Candidatus Polarisedimenticolaceae bacterium]|nr:DUF4382 domain-containing protein [Candidatus Polarisedimenticolaceae bacterium]
MRRSTPALAGLTAMLLTVVAGCSSGNNESHGSLSVAMGASLGTAAASRTVSAADPISQLQAAMITVSAVEAHQTSGTWVVVDAGLPATVDLLAILNGGNPISLPADAIPEGAYDGLQVTITKADLTLTDGTQVSITPPSGGWVVRIPVDFSVVAGQVTEITLQLRCDTSFKVIGGSFVFDPEVDVQGVAHH